MSFFLPEKFTESKRYQIKRESVEKLTEDDIEPLAERQSNPPFLGRAISANHVRFLATLIILFVSSLIGKTAYLQVAKGDYYANLANGNRIRTEKIVPQRGIIYDRNGVPLVRNIPTFSLRIMPLDLPKNDLKKAQILAEVSKIINVPLADIFRKINEYAPNHPNPIIIKSNIAYDEALLIKIQSATLPGIIFHYGYEREYLVQEPYSIARKTQPDSLSHILGYMGTISEEEYKTIDSKNYNITDSIGKNGLEKSYEDVLHGVSGEKQIEVDALGKETKILTQQDPIPGKNIFLTLDINIQQKLEEIAKEMLSKYKKEKSAIVVLDPKDGSILAMVSLPTYNNNDFATGISQEKYSELINNPNHPLFNRAISGMYPSGSIIKPLIASAGLNEGIITPNTTVYSTGGLRINQWFFPDWKAGGHGPTNLQTSLAWSVNTYYYFIGGGYDSFKGLGVDRIAGYLSEFQLGEALGIDLPSEASGFIPSQKWKEETKNERWYIGDTYHLAIGQGDLLVTPLQAGVWTTFFASGGTLYQPHLIKSTQNPYNEKEIQFHNASILNQNIVPQKYVLEVNKGLRATVLWGSAQRLNTLPVTSAAKTGTAQWHSEKDTHSWVTSYAPYENPEIAMVSLVEEGGEGSGISLDITQKFLNWYFGEYKKNNK